MGTTQTSQLGFVPAPASNGVTNGDSHDHSGGDGATIPISGGGTGQTTAQAAIDALTAVSGATIGHALVKDADGHATWAAAGGSNSQEYTTGSGNFTVPAGVHMLYVTGCSAGAGGGGGAGGGASTNLYNAGAGGGGGGTGGSGGSCFRIPYRVTPGAVIAYVVGAKGTGGAGNPYSGGAGSNGTNGTATTFGIINLGIASAGSGAPAHDDAEAGAGGAAGGIGSQITWNSTAVIEKTSMWGLVRRGNTGGPGGAVATNGSTGSGGNAGAFFANGNSGVFGNGVASQGGGGGAGGRQWSSDLNVETGTSGNGGNGGAEGAAGSPGTNADDCTGYGSGGAGGGGGGGGGKAISGAEGGAGGDGGDGGGGYLLIEW